MKWERTIKFIATLFIGLLLQSHFSILAQDGQLLVGWAEIDITPDRPVDLIGNGDKLISKAVHEPITATVLAMETKGADGQKEQAIMISCDLVGIMTRTQIRLQNVISKKLNDFDASKLFMNATHTHKAPWMADRHDLSEDEGAMTGSEYETYFIELTADAIIKAWHTREPAGVSWGLGSAMLGHNRRTVFFDGTASMHRAYLDEFSHYEGKDDHRVQLLFFWDKKQKLKGIVINVACTAQTTGGKNDPFISADYWHEVRTDLKNKYGEDLYVLPQVSSAGDITPFSYDFTYKRAEQVMLDRKGISIRQEMSDRIVRAVEEVMPFAKYDIKDHPVFKHTVKHIELPSNRPDSTFSGIGCDRITEIHVIRLGDVAIATNPFELYLDYGILIKKRSEAILSFLVQLSCGHCGYLPTPRAVKSGGYSAAETRFGPEAGYMLVDETVEILDDFWK